jgi:Acetyltransferases
MIIRHAAESDIPVIEDILLDVMRWMDATGQHLWEEHHMRWEGLLEQYDCTPDNFCILFVDEIPAACMVLLDEDPTFWGLPKGEALYIHKLAVKREFAGQGYSKALIDYAKEVARERSIETVRLDTHQGRTKVRAIYEREGFECVKECTLFGKYHTAFYVYKVK